MQCNVCASTNGQGRLRKRHHVNICMISYFYAFYLFVLSAQQCFILCLRGIERGEEEGEREGERGEMEKGRKSMRVFQGCECTWASVSTRCVRVCLFEQKTRIVQSSRGKLVLHSIYALDNV